MAELARGRRVHMLDEFVQDVRYGVRTLLKHPAFTTTAVLSLALGIGANTAIFSVFDALLVRPLPVAAPNELVLATTRFENQRSLMLGNPQRDAFAASETLAGLCASRHSRLRASMRGGDAQLVEGILASGNCFSLLGVSAPVGRMITEADDRAGAAEPAAVLSYGFWQRQFGGDPAAIGQTIALEDRIFTIVGVAPRGFTGLEPGRPVDVFVPLNALGGALLTNPDVSWLRLLGRRKAGASLERVQADLAVRYARLSRDPGITRRSSTLEIVAASSGFGDAQMTFRLPLRILMAAVVLVLVIACMNVASLLLARASGRRAEIALRVALGASRGRLLRQLLTESVLLSTLGGGLGLALAWIGSPLFADVIRGNADVALEVGPGTRTLMFTGVASLVTGVLFGVLPALHATRGSFSGGAQHGSRVKAGARRWSTALIGAQVALSVVVLFSAGLLLASVRKLQHVDPGFREDNLLMLSIRADKYKGQAARRLDAELRARLMGIPGVESVATFQDAPLTGANVTLRDFSINDVSAGFFETFGIPLVAGRTLTEKDTMSNRPVVVISESVVRRLFPDRTPLGARLLVFGTQSEVVGVVKDARYRSLRLPADPMVYRMASGPGTYAIRTRGDPTLLIAPVRREVQAIARDVPIASLEPYNADATLVRERMVSVLCAWFGAFALALVSIGLYGRLSYSVSERRGEIGVRMALGATRQRVVWIVLKDAVGLTLCAIGAGLPLAIWSIRVIQSLLFAVGPTEFEGWAAILVIAGVSLVAGYVPARDAASVDPVIALRSD